MFGDSYATVQDLEARLNTLDPGPPLNYARILDAASRTIEEFTGRQFNKDTGGSPAATARRFVPVDPQRLPVDDFHTTTALAINVDGTAWAVTDVDPRPWNGIHKGMSGFPYSDLLTKSKTWPSGRRAKVTVTAHWGWATVPEAIKQATLDVAEVISFGSGGQVRSETMGPYSVVYNVPQVGTIVPSELTKAKPYRRVRHGIA